MSLCAGLMHPRAQAQSGRPRSARSLARVLRLHGVAHQSQAITCDRLFSFHIALPGTQRPHAALACPVTARCLGRLIVGRGSCIGASFGVWSLCARCPVHAHRLLCDARCSDAGERIALEADGPYHFTANTLAPNHRLIMRHRLLAARGWLLISVPSYLWQRLNDAGRGAWLLQARPPAALPDCCSTHACLAYGLGD